MEKYIVYSCSVLFLILLEMPLNPNYLKPHEDSRLIEYMKRLRWRQGSLRLVSDYIVLC